MGYHFGQTLQILHEIGNSNGCSMNKVDPIGKLIFILIFLILKKNKTYNFNSSRCEYGIRESPDFTIIPYDYCSIMHHHSKQFIKKELKNDPNAHTIKPLKEVKGCSLGQRNNLSVYDFDAVNIVYNK